MSSGRRVAVIAGGTRGIGFALVRALAAQWGEAGTVYLTARRTEDGVAALRRLADAGVAAEWLQFDLAEPDAAAALAATLCARHGGVDVAVQNGAYAPRGGEPAAAEARPMIAANNHGTLRFLEAFAPIMRPDGRLVVVASGFGLLRHLPPALHARFDTRRNAPAAIDAAMAAYVATAEAGRDAAEGWPDWVNIPSKVGQVAVTRAFARRFTGAPGVLINAACPGLTLTEATRDLMDTVFKGRIAQTPEQAAADLLWLATLAPGTTAPTGELVQHRVVLPFGD